MKNKCQIKYGTDIKTSWVSEQFENRAVMKLFSTQATTVYSCAKIPADLNECFFRLFLWVLHVSISVLMGQLRNSSQGLLSVIPTEVPLSFLSFRKLWKLIGTEREKFHSPKALENHRYEQILSMADNLLIELWLTPTKLTIMIMAPEYLYRTLETERTLPQHLQQHESHNFQTIHQNAVLTLQWTYQYKIQVTFQILKVIWHYT